MKGGLATRLADFAKRLRSTIRQFSPTTYPLKDDDEELLQCVRELKRRLGNMGTVLSDSNEAMRCEYISAILHASPQKRTYLGPPVRSRWRRKHRTCRFRNQGPRGINLYHGRKVVQRGLPIESALKEGSEEEKELHKNVKRVMEVIVGLLKDRVDVEREPVMKKQRVQGISKNRSNRVQ
ncbi:unnamed protein product [Rhizophagus irregularis]|nr:unnamed protein product [Rhizophagus irregularis]